MNFSIVLIVMTFPSQKLTSLVDSVQRHTNQSSASPFSPPFPNFKKNRKKQKKHPIAFHSIQGNISERRTSHEKIHVKITNTYS